MGEQDVADPRRAFCAYEAAPQAGAPFFVPRALGGALVVWMSGRRRPNYVIPSLGLFFLQSGRAGRDPGRGLPAGSPAGSGRLSPSVAVPLLRFAPRRPAGRASRWYNASVNATGALALAGA